MKIIVFVWLALIYSCGPKGVVNKRPNMDLNEPLQGAGIVLDWEFMSEDQSDVKYKFKRSLSLDSGMLFSKDIMTLPVSTPSLVMIDLRVPLKLIQQEVQKIEGFFIQEGLKSELIVSAKNIKCEVQFCSYKIEVQGFKTIFREDRSTKGRLELILWGNSQKQVSVDLALRTPPQKIKLETFDFEESLKKVNEVNDQNYLNPSIGNENHSLENLKLIKLFEISNEELIGVEFVLPVSIEGSMVQKGRRYIHEFTATRQNCRILNDIRDITQVYGQSFLLLPLDGQFNSLWSKVRLNKEVLGKYQLTSGSKIKLGLYLVSHSHQKIEFEKTRLWTQRFPKFVSGCKKDPSLPVEPRDYKADRRFEAHEYPITELSGDCQWGWSVAYDNFIFGQEVELPYLRLNGQSIKARLRFGDLNYSEDTQFRDLELLTKDTILSELK